MATFDKLWSFKTKHFEVFCEATPEDDPDLSWADEETLARLERGIYVNICWHIGVLHNGHEIGTAYLGNSIYEDPRDFLHEHRGIQSYFSDMVREAIAEARRTMEHS